MPLAQIVSHRQGFRPSTVSSWYEGVAGKNPLRQRIGTPGASAAFEHRQCMLQKGISRRYQCAFHETLLGSVLALCLLARYHARTTRSQAEEGTYGKPGSYSTAQARASLVRGKVTVKVDPFPTALSTVMVPP